MPREIPNQRVNLAHDSITLTSAAKNPIPSDSDVPIGNESGPPELSGGPRYLVVDTLATQPAGLVDCSNDEP